MRDANAIYAELLSLNHERRKALAAHRSVEARAARLLTELHEADSELAELVTSQGPPTPSAA